MAAISIAAIRRQLIPGTTYLGEFVGINRLHCVPGMECTRRRITKNSETEMVSQMLTGPKQGHHIGNPWKGVKARQDGEDIILSVLKNDSLEDYLKITICPER